MWATELLEEAAEELSAEIAARKVAEERIAALRGARRSRSLSSGQGGR